MRFWPRSLKGRLTLLLFSVLLVAQLFSAAMHYRDRLQILKEASGYNLAQRITGMVVVLDQSPPDRRETFARAMDVPPLHVALLDQPKNFSGEHPESTRASLFQRLLRFSLGQDRNIMVLMPEKSVPKGSPVDSSVPRLPASMPERMRRMMESHMGRPMSIPVAGLVAQVQLTGGKWALFTYQFPDELVVWPLDLLMGLLVLLLAVWLVSYIAVRWLISPLSTLAQAAEELGKNIGHAPLSTNGPLEVRQAALAFNTMQQRLARFLDERIRIFTAISHDLKTPLTRMRLRIEQIDDRKLYQSFEHDLADMQAMVQSSLDFMRGIDLQEEPRPIDIDALTGSLAEDAQEAGDRVRVLGSATRPYPGRPLALKRAIRNLLGNAIRYAGSAEVEIRDSDTELRILVRDDGPGIPAELLEKVFEPFFRVDGSRNSATGGTGLGLSITRSIARAQGGDLVLRNRPQGGLEAELILPR